jgi:hypothetical protein
VSISNKLVKQKTAGKSCCFLFGGDGEIFLSTIESATGTFSQIFPAASCTKNLEFRFESRPDNKNSPTKAGEFLLSKDC